MGTLRDKMIRDIKRMEPDELIAVMGMIEALRKQDAPAVQAGGQGRQRALKALAGIRSSLAESVASAREDRL